MKPGFNIIYRETEEAEGRARRKLGRMEMGDIVMDLAVVATSEH